MAIVPTRKTDENNGCSVGPWDKNGNTRRVSTIRGSAGSPPERRGFLLRGDGVVSEAPIRVGDCAHACFPLAMRLC